MPSHATQRGISPVIAVLLLIVIAVAASVITYSWITWFLTTQQQAASSMIRIEEVDLSRISEGIITVYVRNIGTVKVTIDAVYVNGTRWNISRSIITISPNQLDEIIIVKPPLAMIPTPKSGNVIVIKVATRVGTFDIYRGIVP